MKTLLIVAIAVVAAALSGCDADPVRPDNQAPVVQSLIVGQAGEVYVGDACAVVCTAVDPDGDPLTFEWAVGSGYSQGAGREIVYTPLSCCLGGNPVFVIVRDGKGGETRAELFIPVTP
jgi:hypothetical protein